MIRPLRFVKRVTLSVAFGLLAITVFNSWQLRSKQIAVPPRAPRPLDEAVIIERFARAITFKTISAANPAHLNTDEFGRFRSYLEEAFPRVHDQLTRYTGKDWDDDRNLSLLFKWEGSRRTETDPVLLMAHYDVVGVASATLTRWTHPPFSGHVDDEFVWGRGTLDCKSSVMAILESIEGLIVRGFVPQQTLYISLGHDEEVGGLQGNKQIAEWMQQQGIRFEFVLDEGGCIYSEFPGVSAPVAVVGVAEKGYLTVRLQVMLKEAGHSSMPPPHTAIGILAEAVHRLNENPFPQRLNGGADLMLDYLGPEMPLANRFAIANQWLFSPLIMRKLGAKPAGNATLRTTLAPTIIAGGFKETVLPTNAEVTVNVRILPGDSVASVMDRMHQVVNDDRVLIKCDTSVREPSRISSTESKAFKRLHTTIKEVFPDTLVAPFVVVAGTDSSHFDKDSLRKDVYRFLPSRLGEKDLSRLHGINERISKSNYLEIVRFFTQLIENTSEGAKPPLSGA